MAILNLVNKTEFTEGMNEISEQLNKVSERVEHVASFSNFPNRDYEGNGKIKPLSEINGTVEDNRPFRDYKKYFENGVGKHVMSIMPKAALEDKPVFYDIDTSGDLVDDSPFVDAMSKLFSPNYGTGKGASHTIFDKNKINLENTIFDADVYSYGRYGAVYISIEGDEPSEPIDFLKENALNGVFALSEEQAVLLTNNYTVKLDDDNIITNVHPDRIVRITTNGLTYHTPRIKDIFIEVTNVTDLMLSLRNNLAISSPKIKVTLPDIEMDTTTIAFYIKEMVSYAMKVVNQDADILIGNTNSEFILPEVRSISQQLMDTWQGIATKKSIPLRILLGTEQYKSASEQDSKNFASAVSQYQKNHLIPNIIKPLVSRLIYANIVPNPLDKANLGFYVDWPTDNSDTIQSVLDTLDLASDVRASVAGIQNQTAANLDRVLEHLSNKLLKLYNIE